MLALHGETHEVATVDDAISFIRKYSEKSFRKADCIASRLKFDTTTATSSRDDLAIEKAAIDFLRGFQPVSPKLRIRRCCAIARSDSSAQRADRQQQPADDQRQAADRDDGAEPAPVRAGEDQGVEQSGKDEHAERETPRRSRATRRDGRPASAMPTSTIASACHIW